MPLGVEVVKVNNGVYDVYVIKDDEYITNTIANGYEWDGWMREDVEKCYRENTEILDIGANIGYNSLMFSDYGPVYSFEPLFHEIVKMNAENNTLKHKMHSVPVALSNENKTTKMYLARKVEETGLRNYGGSSMYTFEGTDYSTETDVRCCILDDIYKGFASFIKIDVEGHELKVLEGAKNTIKRCNPTILIEIHDFDKNNEVHKYLKELGYDDPIERPECMFLYLAKGIFSTI